MIDHLEDDRVSYVDAVTGQPRTVVMDICWRWSPTWTWAWPKGRDPYKVWTGQEVLLDQEGKHVAEYDASTDRFGGAICRRAPPPDRPPPTDEECDENHRRDLARQQRAAFFKWLDGDNDNLGRQP